MTLGIGMTPHNQMDLELQLLTSPAQADNNGRRRSLREVLQRLVLVVRCSLLFVTAGRDAIAAAAADIHHQGFPPVSGVSSSKTNDSSHDAHETVRIAINMEEVGCETAAEAQTMPFLNPVNNGTTSPRQKMRTLVHVLHSSLLFRAGANVSVAQSSAEVKIEIETESVGKGAGDGLRASSEHNIVTDETIKNEMTVDHQLQHSQSQNIWRIVREKDLPRLQKLGLRGVADALHTDLKKGISDNEADCRKRKANSLHPIPVHRFSHFLLKALNSLTILLLSLGVVLSVGFGIKEEGLKDGWVDGAIMLATMIILILFASILEYWQERRAWKMFEEQHLPKARDGEVHVIRGGEDKFIHTSDLVYGDIVLLKEGYEVPADGLFVAGQDLELDYGSESCEINEENPFLSYGERVIKGEAQMVMIPVDLETEWRQMMIEATGDPDRKSELEDNLNKFNTCMHNIGLVNSIVILIVLFIRYKVGKIDDDNGYRLESKAEPAQVSNFTNSFKKIIQEWKCTPRALIMLLSVSLVGMTEGVPFIVSLVTFHWNKKALSGKAKEQDLLAAAKMASVTRICTDKLRDFTEDELGATKTAVTEGAQCGVKIVLVSQENVSVLQDIARQCGLITTGDSLVLTGEAFRNSTDKENVVDKICIIGEALPRDKRLFVENLRKKGEVVLFIGQKTDEAPALKEADIGIAMGIGRSNRVRDNSDIILEASFADLIVMVNSCKSIHRNFQKFLQLILIMTIASTLINLILTVTSGSGPLTAVQMIWLNLTVPFFLGYALLTEPLMDKPVSMDTDSGRSSLITADMIRNIAIQVIYQVILLVALQVKGSGILGTSQQDIKSMVFYSFILFQLCNQFMARELKKKNFFKGIHRRDKWFWVRVAAFVVLQGIFVKVEVILGYGSWLNCKLWFVCFLIGAASWPIDWLGKCTSKMLETFATILRR